MPIRRARLACDGPYVRHPRPSAGYLVTDDQSSATRRCAGGRARLDPVYVRAAGLPRLRSRLVFQRDTLRRERYYHGARAEQPANIKSASKSVISALVGIAIARGELRDVEQTLGELLPAETR